VEAEGQVVVFSVLGEHYGLSITSVREIIRYTPPRATATARGLIRGMLNLRDRLIPVLDLSPLLGGQLEIGAGSRILVVELSSGPVGVVVDSVDGIVRVSADQVAPLPAAANRELGEEIAALDDRLVVLIDPERIALAAGLAAPARRSRRAAPGSRESKPAPSDPGR
jgi:chemotaxis signal transduction protein